MFWPDLIGQAFFTRKFRFLPYKYMETLLHDIGIGSAVRNAAEYRGSIGDSVMMICHIMMSLMMNFIMTVSC